MQQTRSAEDRRSPVRLYTRMSIKLCAYAQKPVMVGDVLIAIVKEEVHDFYKTSWFIEFETLSRIRKVQGSCDMPLKRYS